MKMRIRNYETALAPWLLVAALIALVGCAAPRSSGYYGGPAGGSYVCSNCGTVDSIREVYTEGNENSAVIGTVIGAVVGGALGNQVGKGDGRKAATVGGAVAGGAIGHQVGERNAGGSAWRIGVNLDDGRYATVTQRQRPDVRLGEYVQIRNDRIYRR